MAITYTIKPNKIYTHTLDGLTNVIKRVEWTITGKDGTVEFALPNTTTLADPEQQTFVPLEQITEQMVIEWIEAQELRLPSIKDHIALVVERELEKQSLTDTQMPWAPVPEPMPAPQSEITTPTEPVPAPPPPTNP
jgi:hypothetical protein